MNRSRLIFFVIVGAAVVLVSAGIMADQLSTSDSSSKTNDTQGSGAVTLTAAVSPLAEDWLEQAVQSYNRQQRRVDGQVVEIKLIVQDSVPIWTSPGQWSVANHPMIWVPEMGASVEYANQSGLKFSILNPSVASTVMLWGAPADRAQVLLDQYTALDWYAVQQASATSAWTDIGGQAEWRFFKPGFAQPDRYSSGLAAVLVATAEFSAQVNLGASQLNDPALTTWLKPIFDSVPNFATLGIHPAETLAARGASVADVMLLPESEWLVNYAALTQRLGALILAYPDYQVWFDFPFAIWNDAEVSKTEKAAAQDFLNFLLGADQQRQAAEFGLRLADGTPASPEPFERAASAGAILTKPGGEMIQMPADRNTLVPFVKRDWTAY